MADFESLVLSVDSKQANKALNDLEHAAHATGVEGTRLGKAYEDAAESLRKSASAIEQSYSSALEQLRKQNDIALEQLETARKVEAEKRKELSAIDRQISAYNSLITKLEAVNGTEADIAKVKEKLVAATNKQAIALHNLQSAQASVAASASQYDNTLRALVAEETNMSREISETVQKYREGAQVIASTQTYLEAYNQRVAELDRLLHAGAISQQEYNMAVSQLKQASSETNSVLGAIEGMVNNLLRTLTVGALAWKAYSLAMRGISLAQADIQAAAKMDAVIASTGKNSGFTAKQAHELSKRMQELTVYTKQQVDNGIALISTFSIQSDLMERAMTVASDMATVVGSLDGAAQGLGKALEMPSQGLSALTRQGFRFTAEQKNLIKEMDKAGKTYEAQVYMLDAIQASQSGVAEAFAKTTAGQLQQAKNQYESLQATIGERLLPVLTLFQKILNSLMDVIIKHTEIIIVAGIAFTASLVPGIIAGTTALNTKYIPAVIAATKATLEFTAAMLKNPFFMAGAIVGAGILLVVEAVKKHNAAVKEYKDHLEEIKVKALNLSDAETVLYNVEQKLKDLREEVMLQDMTELQRKEYEATKKIKTEQEQLNSEIAKAYKLYSDIEAKRNMETSTDNRISFQLDARADYGRMGMTQSAIGAYGGATQAELDVHKENIKTYNEQMNELLSKIDEFWTKYKELEEINAKNIQHIHKEHSKELAKIRRGLELDMMESFERQWAMLDDDYKEKEKQLGKEDALLKKWLIHKRKELIDNELSQYEDQTDALEKEFTKRLKSLTSILGKLATTDPMFDKTMKAMLKLAADTEEKRVAIKKRETAALMGEEDKIREQTRESQKAVEDALIAAKKGIEDLETLTALDTKAKVINIDIAFAGAEKLTDYANHVKDTEDNILGIVKTASDKEVEEMERRMARLKNARDAGNEKALADQSAVDRINKQYYDSMVGKELTLHEQIAKGYDERIKANKDAMDKLSEDDKDYYKNLMTLYDVDKKLHQQKNAAIKKSDMEVLAAMPGQFDARIALVRQKLEEERKVYADNAEMLKAKEKKANEDITAIRLEQFQEGVEHVQAYMNAVMPLITAISNAFSNAFNKRVTEIDKESAKQKEAVSKSGATHRMQAAEMEAIDKETEKRKHDMALRQWRLDLVMATVSGAQAIINAMTAQPWPVAIAAVAATTAATGIQLGIIASNKPTMEHGGFVPGNSYHGDRVNIGVNSGEAVLNPAQQRTFMNLANMGVPRANLQEVRGPSQAALSNIGVGAMQQREETVQAPEPVVEQTTVATVNIYDDHHNIAEQVRASIRSGEFNSVMREALQAIGR